jgi:hypothetical protein
LAKKESNVGRSKLARAAQKRLKEERELTNVSKEDIVLLL